MRFVADDKKFVLLLLLLCTLKNKLARKEREPNFYIILIGAYLHILFYTHKV